VTPRITGVLVGFACLHHVPTGRKAMNSLPMRHNTGSTSAVTDARALCMALLRGRTQWSRSSSWGLVVSERSESTLARLTTRPQRLNCVNPCKTSSSMSLRHSLLDALLAPPRGHYRMDTAGSRFRCAGLQSLTSRYIQMNNEHQGSPPQLALDETRFSAPAPARHRALRVPGMMCNARQTGQLD